MGRPFKCPYCGSTDTTGKGVRKTKSMGVRRIRRCKACRRKFTPRSQQFVEARAGSGENTTIASDTGRATELLGAPASDDAPR